MAVSHSGNIQPGLDLEEHDGINYSKKVTIGAVSVAIPISFSGNVTTSSPGGVTVFQGTNPWSTSVIGNLTLSDPKTYIGLVSVSHAAWVDPKTYIGLVTSTPAGNTTLNASSANIGSVSVLGGNIGISGNVTLSDPKTYIGLVTVTHAGNVTLNASNANIGSVSVLGGTIGIVGNVTLSDSKTYIGLVTTTLAAVDTKSYLGLVTVSHAGNVSLNASSANIGSVSVLGGLIGVAGNVTLSDSKTYIGLVTNTLAAVDTKSYLGLMTVSNALAWTDPKTYIGLVTITGSLAAASGNVTLDPGSKTGIVGNITLSDSKANIGLVTLTGGTAWTDPKTYIGLVTITGSLAAASGNVTLDAGSKTQIVGNVTLSDAKTYVGLTTSTLGVGTTFVGLVTAWTRNAGSAKALTPFAVTLSTSSVATIVVPTNAQSMYITNIVLNSDATVRVSLKSGVTYMTGNASLGITLNPGGGFVMTGAPDSPSWVGLPSGALVVEKFDMTGTKANIGGHIVTFTE